MHKWPVYFNIGPHEAAPEVSTGKVHITQNKHVPIEWFVTTASHFPVSLLIEPFVWWSNKVGICLLCRSTQLHATTSCRSQFATTCASSYVLQSSTPYWKSTTPVLLCTTKYYSSTTLYYKVLLQYYKVLLQYYSVLQNTSKYYASTTLYYNVLLRTTKYYSSTTLYYTALLQLQYYSATKY